MAKRDIEKMKNAEIFGDKTFEDLLEEIYERSNKTQDKIKDLLTDLAPLITNVSNASLIAPVIADYLDISIKNDDQLIKLASIIQKHLKDTGAKDEVETGLIPKEELEQIRDAVASRKGKVVNL